MRITDCTSLLPISSHRRLSLFPFTSNHAVSNAPVLPSGPHRRFGAEVVVMLTPPGDAVAVCSLIAADVAVLVNQDLMPPSAHTDACSLLAAVVCLCDGVDLVDRDRRSFLIDLLPARSVF
jgi:hypothetical protein